MSETSPLAHTEGPCGLHAVHYTGPGSDERDPQLVGDVLLVVGDQLDQAEKLMLARKNLHSLLDVWRRGDREVSDVELEKAKQEFDDARRQCHGSNQQPPGI